MKARGLWCGLAIGMLALAGPAAGATYTDAATNYPGGAWTNGSNGGTGFEAWSIVADSGTGWAGNGIWDSTVAGLGMGEAFGFAGRGNGYINIDRELAQALNTNDTLELDFGVNYDSGSGNKGFNLYANGIQVVNINNGGTAAITINGSPALANYGTNTMHWTFTQVAPNQIGVNATGRDGAETFATTVTTASSYGYIGALRFYAANVSDDFQNERQSYFDNLELTQEGTPPPEPLVLTFTDGVYSPAATGEYYFALARTGGVSNDLVLASSNTNAVVVPAAVSFAEGSNSVSFNADVISLTAGPATIVASNADTGAWAEYVVTPVAPLLTISGDAIQISGGVKNYTLERSASTGTNILLSSSDTGVVTVPVDLVYGAGAYSTTFPATFVGFGTATLTASNPATGAAATFNVTYQAPALAVLGLTRSWAGGVESYRVTRAGAVGDTVNIVSSDTNVMTSAQASVTFGAGENTAYFNAQATGAGAMTWTASNDDATSPALAVTVEAAPDFGAYDDASLYASWSLTPAHVSGFPDWTEELSAEQANSYRGSFINTALIPGINVGGAAFGLYANYSGAVPSPLPEVKVSRAFPAPMATGQVFSVDVGYNWNSGTKGFKLKGEFEGNAYDRFELFNSGNDTWSYKLDGNDATIAVVWSGYIAGGFVGRVQAICTAPNTFTFSFLREGDAAPTLVEDVVLPGTIDQVEFYSYNGGSGDAENFTFNRMWLSAAEGPGPAPEIGPITYSGGNLVCPVPAGYTNGTVYGADCTVDAVGAWPWVVLTNGVDYTVSGGAVTVPTAEPAPGRRIIRVDMIAVP